MNASLKRQKAVNFFRLVTAFLLLVGLGLPAATQASTQAQDGTTPWPEPPLCNKGTLGQQITLICVPPGDSWNHTLIVYAHGFVPPQVPLALPAGELSRITLPGGVSFVTLLLSQGFAFATTSYSKNGYAVQQAEADINSLVAAFKLANPDLNKVLVVGASEGGLITTELIERDWQSYSGGLALCGPVGGAPYQVKYLGDFRVVFDYFFPGIFGFGVKDVPDNAFLNWDTDVIKIGTALTTNPENTRQLFKVTHAALDSADPVGSAISTTVQALFYSIWETPDTIATAGGNPFGNRFTLYFGSNNDRLLNLGVERVSADPAAAAYMRQYYQTTGYLQRPLITLHTLQDPQVPFVHELLYFILTLSKGKLANLTIFPVNRYGHCNFTPEEALGAFSLLLSKTGLASKAIQPYQKSLPQPFEPKTVYIPLVMQ